QRTMAVPRPVALLPDCATIITQWIEAPTLRTVLLNERRQTALMAVGAAAAWLANFHATSAQKRHTFRPDYVLTPVSNELASGLRPSGARQMRRFYDALDRLETLATALRGTTIPWTTLHYDANCQNFLFDGESAYGFDIHNTAPGDPMKDFARLLVEADLLWRHHWGRPRSAVSRPVLDAVVQRAGIQLSSDVEARLRVHLLSASLIKYLRTPRTQAAVHRQQRRRALAIATAAASFRFNPRATPFLLGRPWRPEIVSPPAGPA
ncbi:MAG: phosphotransferase, partial [Pseudomonadota bacterium]